MDGLWGKGAEAGPGSIWKIDGTTGQISHFASIRHNGLQNSGSALGNIVFDPQSRQLFVSDLQTGLIHRVNLYGVDGGQFDHGIEGRKSAGQKPVEYDATKNPAITKPEFKTTDSSTWGYAPALRRVYGLAVRDGRLYYGLADGPSIWSVEIKVDGNFGTVRWEVTLPTDGSAQEGAVDISKITFTKDGRMIAAERALPGGDHEFCKLTRDKTMRVFAFVPESSDPPVRQRWHSKPGEYAIGKAGEHRNTNGSVAIGFGYKNGRLDRAQCSMLWTTGQALTEARSLFGLFGDATDAKQVRGLQGNQISLVRPANVPPETAYYIDYDERFGSPGERGFIGDVEILANCSDPTLADTAALDRDGAGGADESGMKERPGDPHGIEDGKETPDGEIPDGDGPSEAPTGDEGADGDQPPEAATGDEGGDGDRPPETVAGDERGDGGQPSPMVGGDEGGGLALAPLPDPTGREPLASVREQSPELALNKMFFQCLRNGGGPGVYRYHYFIRITNIGAADHNGTITFNDRMDGATFYDVTALRVPARTSVPISCVELAPGDTACTLPSVQVSPSGVILARLSFDIPSTFEGGEVENCAQLADDSRPAGQESCVFSTICDPTNVPAGSACQTHADLALLKLSDESTVTCDVGGVCDFTIWILNRGAAPVDVPANAIQLRDQMEGPPLIFGQPISTTSPWNCRATGNQTICGNPDLTMAAAGIEIITLRYRVPEDYPHCVIRNCISIVNPDGSQYTDDNLSNHQTSARTFECARPMARLTAWISRSTWGSRGRGLLRITGNLVHAAT